MTTTPLYDRTTRPGAVATIHLLRRRTAGLVCGWGKIQRGEGTVASPRAMRTAGECPIRPGFERQHHLGLEQVGREDIAISLRA